MKVYLCLSYSDQILEQPIADCVLPALFSYVALHELKKGVAAMRKGWGKPKISSKGTKTP